MPGQQSFREALNELYLLWCERRKQKNSKQSIAVSTFAEESDKDGVSSIARVLRGDRKTITVESINALLNGLYNDGDGIIDADELEEWKEKLHVAWAYEEAKKYLPDEVVKEYEDIGNEFAKLWIRLHRKTAQLWKNIKTVVGDVLGGPEYRLSGNDRIENRINNHILQDQEKTNSDDVLLQEPENEDAPSDNEALPQEQENTHSDSVATTTKLIQDGTDEKNNDIRNELLKLRKEIDEESPRHLINSNETNPLNISEKIEFPRDERWSGLFDLDDTDFSQKLAYRMYYERNKLWNHQRRILENTPTEEPRKLMRKNAIMTPYKLLTVTGIFGKGVPCA